MMKRFWTHFASPAMFVAVFVAQAQGQGFEEGITPLGMASGAPAGSYALSDLDNVNLFNGTLNFRLPLLTIGGRGEARHTLVLPIEQHWGIKSNKSQTNPQVFPRFNWFRGVKPGYGPGVLMAYFDRDNDTDTDLKRMTFTASDGTQYEFRDALTDGVGLGAFDNRGRDFRTNDGTAITFRADADVHDRSGTLTQDATGVMMLPNGMLYRVDQNVVSRIRDRNGNQITFQYDASTRQVTSITDSLNRTYTVAYVTGVSDTITFKGHGGATRTIVVAYSDLGQALAPGQSLSTLAGLFPEITNWGFPTQSFNPKVVSSVTLPDNRQYVLRYNRYGELARVTLPTGGRIEYTYQAGQPSIAASGAIPGAPPVIYRRVGEKKTFTSAGSSTPVTWTVFGQEDDTSPDPIFGGNSQSIAVQHKDPGSGNVLSEEQHYFFGRSSDNLFSSTPLDYPVWRHGREYRTEIISGGNVVRAVDNTWAQRPCSGPWCGNPNHDEPAVDPRLMATTTTLSDAGLVSQQLFNYDTYNNRTSVSEYAFGAGSAGALVRRRETDYLTFFGSGNYATDFNIHLRRLPLQERTFDSIGIERARTTYEYDSYSTDARHDALLGYANITGMDPVLQQASYTTRGNVTGVLRWRDNPGATITTSRLYDVAGSVVKTIDGVGNATTFTYSDRFGAPNGEAQANTAPPELSGNLKTHAFPSLVTNALGHLTYTQIDYYLGRPVDQQDPTGIVGSALFADPLDRPTEVIRDNRSAPTKAGTRFVYNDASNIVTTYRDRDAYNDSKERTEVVFDGLGRETESRVYEGSGTSYIATRKGYDGLGRLSRVSNPFRPNGGETEQTTTTVYDALNRVVSVTTPDTATVTTSYLGNQTTVTDQAGKARRSFTDALGRLTTVVEDPSGLNYTTSYLYDTLDNLITVGQGTQTRTFTYDSLSQLLSATNPESGTMLYGDSGIPGYDANGNLIRKRDARGVIATMLYDGLNRITNRNYNSVAGVAATPNVTYVYDTAAVPNSRGRLTGVTSSASTTGFLAYDALGRVTQSRQSTSGVDYNMSYGYDLGGNLTSETYPSGRVVTTTYDVAGRASRIAEGSAFYAEQIAYASHGGVLSLRLGNGLWESATFNSRLQPLLMGLGASPSNRAVLQLNYGNYGGAANNGNVLTQTISIGSVSLGQTYTYDGLNRLATATETRAGVQSWTQTYGYDRWGNRAVTAGAVLTPSLTPTSLGNFSTATNRLTMGTAQYDAAGNLTRDSATPTPMNFVYDGENRQTSAGTTTYTYDGDGRRVRKVVSGTTNTYVYDVMGRLVAEYLPSATPGPVYLTADHLGSTRVATDQTASIVERHDFLPFGEEIPVSASAYGNRAGIPGYGTDTVRQKFAGKERDNESGSHYFGARYHSGAQGRFTSIDPIALSSAKLLDPQQLDMYTYVRNNPLRLVDPVGEEVRLAELTDEERALLIQNLQAKTGLVLKYDSKRGILQVSGIGSGGSPTYRKDLVALIGDKATYNVVNTSTITNPDGTQDQLVFGAYNPKTGTVAIDFADFSTTSPEVDLGLVFYHEAIAHGLKRLTDDTKQLRNAVTETAKVGVELNIPYLADHDLTRRGDQYFVRVYMPFAAEGTLRRSMQDMGLLGRQLRSVEVTGAKAKRK